MTEVAAGWPRSEVICPIVHVVSTVAVPIRRVKVFVVFGAIKEPAAPQSNQSIWSRYRPVPPVASVASAEGALALKGMIDSSTAAAVDSTAVRARRLRLDV